MLLQLILHLHLRCVYNFRSLSFGITLRLLKGRNVSLVTNGGLFTTPLTSLLNPTGVVTQLVNILVFQHCNVDPLGSASTSRIVPVFLGIEPQRALHTTFYCLFPSYSALSGIDSRGSDEGV